VGALALVELVPLVTLTLLGGALADALDRRRLLIWTQIGMAVTGVGLVVNAAVAEPRAWACFVLAFFSASFFCLGIGGMRSITPKLVAEDKLPAALVLQGISGSFA
jgi:nitrate/nitrite transporter NarK